MPVTTRIMTELSGSSRKPQSAEKVARWPLAMWKGRPASQVNWMTWWVRSGRFGKLKHRAEGEDEREQHHARADQLDQPAGGRRVMVAVGMLVGMRHDRDRARGRDRGCGCDRDRARDRRGHVPRLRRPPPSDGGCGSSILPKSNIRAAPQSGKSGISQMRSKKFICMWRPSGHAFTLAAVSGKAACPTGFATISAGPPRRPAPFPYCGTAR